MASNQLKNFRLLLSLTGHNFSSANKRAPIKRNAHLTLIFVILALGVYQSIWFLYNNVLRCGLLNLYMLRFMIWTSKGICVQLFLLHLGMSGQIGKLSGTIFGGQDRAKSRRRGWLLGASFAIYLCLIVSGFIYFLLRMYKVVDAQYHFKYGSPSEIFIRNLMWLLTMWMVTTTLILYNFCVLTVLDDVHGFSAEIEASSNVVTSSKEEGGRCPISKLFKDYSAIMKQVDCLDNTFKIYLFFMLALNIPITISTLLRSFKSHSAGPWQYLFIVPENMFCWFELIALTAFAAELNILLRKVPKAFYMSMPMDSILDGSSKLEPTRALFFHFATNQCTNLGLTLWEFTTITKPLIMTVVSLVATYLTVTLQFLPAETNENDIWTSLNGTILC